MSRFALLAITTLLVCVNAQTSVYIYYNYNNALWWISATIQSIGGLSWGQPSLVLTTFLPSGPTPVSFSDQIYVFHSGMDNDIWVNAYTPSTNQWSGDTQLFVGTNTNVFSIGATETQGLLIGLYTDGTNLYYSIGKNINTWGPLSKVGNINAPSSGPNVIQLGTTIYAFYQGIDSQLFYNSFDGTTWITDIGPVSGIGITGAPSTIVYNNVIYLFHQGNNNGQLWYSTFDSTTWTKDIWIGALIQPIAPTSAPSVVYVAPYFYIFYVGTDSLLYYTAITPNGAQGPIDQVYNVSQISQAQPGAITF